MIVMFLGRHSEFQQDRLWPDYSCQARNKYSPRRQISVKMRMCCILGDSFVDAVTRQL